jgi:hypothetical protein
LPAGNFLDFPFLQARGGPRGFRRAEAMSPEGPKPKVAGGQLGPPLFVMALLPHSFLPETYESYGQLMTISPVKVTAQESFKGHLDPRQQGATSRGHHC